MPKKKKTPPKFVRLPGHIVPQKYKLEISPDTEAGTFTGSEEIAVKIGKKDKQVVLHSRELEITSAEAIHGKSTIWAAKVTYDTERELATLVFPKALPTGKAVLRLSFRGVLNNYLRGYYRSKYQHEGVEKHLATTQFEATDARMAFPCFDEPNKKAVFELSVTVPTHHEVVSNTLPVSISEGEGLKTVKFAPTPKMSTYLLAFVSGELDFIETKSRSGVQIRAFTTRGKKDQAKFALEFTRKTLEFYEQYFKIPYPLKTLDLVAIPDFASLAMENWGVITFRESGILIEEGMSSLSRKQLVAMVLAHELAHQWFGNLVTMDWWTHLWLNEGFASYIEFLAVDKLYPKWDMWTQFLSLDYIRGREKDALLSTHEIEVDVHDPNEIDEVFDDISYRKGASIIRMLANFLGEKVFQKGLQHYLYKHKYKNATTQDLWKSLEQVSGKPVQKIMSAWTLQPGFPLVEAEQREGEWFVRQERFFANPKHQGSVKTLWPVPLSYLGSGSSKKILLEETDQKLGLKDTNLVKLNLRESAFTVSNYPTEHWEKLCELVKKGSLGPEDRWGVANNLWTLARSGYLPTSKVLELSMAFRRETEISVWRELISGLTQVKNLFASEGKLLQCYENYIQLLLEPTKKRLGFDIKKEDTHHDSLLRPLCFAELGQNGDIQVQERALHLLAKAVRGPKVPVHIRTAVYSIVARLGDRPEFSYFKKCYVEEESHEERERLGKALCSFTQHALIANALEFSLSSHVRSQDAIFFPRDLGGDAKVQKQLWQFIRKNWGEYSKRYGHGGRGLNVVVRALAKVSEPEVLQQMTTFFKKHSRLGLARTIEQTLESADILCQWKKRDQADVEKFLERFS